MDSGISKHGFRVPRKWHFFPRNMSIDHWILASAEGCMEIYGTVNIGNRWLWFIIAVSDLGSQRINCNPEYDGFELNLVMKCHKKLNLVNLYP